ncbi:nucleotide sugar dehydrogenase [Candidatus Magnetominusculus xianensis]|uniref:Nucleotide sugar dehydrogenase n=1 Tax=Candidatus Magnetominusculus xianensis TaxID=1748249 RepID=A0ABR5SJA8_9BACT|nr:nucleotide sugar dehydrogenase [Candidatus Magnetominusculus xianensis]KWT94352.1 nucleotide sugar dehydrogenase [Candidatus Magnetominusculus xianensis]MBF0403998.1 nucleotide sugar dehydrogenase [Nitrospirota bacterium]
MGYDVCVVGGLGHVGLPLGIMLAEVGKKVVLYDINTKAIETVSKGKMPFLETGAEEILSKVINNTLFVSNDRAVITESHYVIIVIGTPVDEHLNPQFTIFKQFFDDLSGCLKDGQHIILRSTVFPGTTEKIKEYLAAKGKNVRVSFCPERIAEGKAIVELRELPQIVASFDSDSEVEAARLFEILTDDIMYLTPIEAELAKLFTNVWRYIQFSISNQFYQIAAQHKLDFYKIYSAITYKYPRAASFPSAGFAAGPCLFKDTMQLAAFSNNSFFLGHAAMLINEGLPNFIVSTLKDRYSLKEKTVGILGMAFKANNDDKRESLSYKLKKILEIESKQVLCSDVYINERGFVTAEALVSAADIIVLGTPHKEYADLNIQKDKVMVDVWNFFGNGGLF